MGQSHQAQRAQARTSVLLGPHLTRALSSPKGKEHLQTACKRHHKILHIVTKDDRAAMDVDSSR